MSYKKTKKTEKVNNIQWYDAAQSSESVFCFWQVLRLEIAVFLLLLSSKLCMESVFTDLQFGSSYLFLGCLLSVGMLIGVGLEKQYASNNRYRMCLFYVLLYTIPFVWYFLDRREYIVNGIRNFYHIYLSQFNFYYKTNFEDFGSGSPHELGVSVGFVLLALLVLLLVCCFVTGCFRWMGIFPLLVIMAQMAIGWSPDFWGLAVGLGGFLMLPSGRRKVGGNLHLTHAESGEKRSLAMITIMLVCALLSLTVPAVSAGLFSDQAKELNEKADLLKRKQLAMEEQISGILQWVFPGDGLDVDNRKPIYQQKEVFIVTLDTHGDTLDDSGETMSACSSNIYLRSDYGDYYRNGSWKADDEAFSKACEEAGWEAKEVSANLAGQTDVAMREKFHSSIYVQVDESEEEKEITMNTQSWNYTIDYTGKKQKRNLIPYGICVTDSDLDFVGEYRLDGRRKKQQIFDAWPVEFGQMPTFYMQHVSLFFDIENEGEIEKWYDSYVKEHDLPYPEGSVPTVDALAERFGFSQEYVEILLDRDAADPMTINIWRVTQAEIISEIFKQRGTYSMELAGIDDGTDATEYFLSHGMKGYCSHFASAGTLILRNLGIPARYASGYVIPKENFQKNDDGTYTAHVLDTASHNWVEVYLTGIGWVPIEMTPGYAQMAYGTIDDTQSDGAHRQFDNRPYMQDHLIDQKDDMDIQTEQSDQTNGNADRNKNEKVLFWIVMVGILLFSVVVVALYLYVQGLLKKRNRRQLKLMIEQRKNKRAVQKMNRQIYKRLAQKNLLVKKDISDRMYQQILRQTYVQLSTDEVEHFMEIVKKAAFSLEEISDEEVAAVYAVFVSVQK